MKNSNVTTGNRTRDLSVIKEELMNLVSFSVLQTGFGFHINIEKFKVVKKLQYFEASDVFMLVFQIEMIDISLRSCACIKL